MNKCLCCGKILKKDEVNGWHVSCIKKYFGVKHFPVVSLDKDAIERIALSNVQSGLTIPGVQKKLSLHLSVFGKDARLTLVDYPTSYILKPPVDEYECLPELEQLSMAMADYLSISTVPHALIKVDDEFAYISKRIDRIIDGETISKLAMEDFCQLDLRNTIDKYKGSYERCVKIIKRYSSRPGLDLSELFMRVVFSYIIGNSDMHLKNLSMIETKCGSGTYILSPAYDLLAVQVVLIEDDEEFALSLNGKKKNITMNDFYDFASTCGISKIASEKMIHKIVSSKDKLIDLVNESFISEKMKKRFNGLIISRCKTFE